MGHGPRHPVLSAALGVSLLCPKRLMCCFSTPIFSAEEIEKKLNIYRKGCKIWKMLIFCQVC